MKERPIIMSAFSVRALFHGTKTVTRRVVKPQPPYLLGLQRMWGTSPPPNPVAFGTPGHFRIVGADYPDDARDDRYCPYGAPGDRLWVKETWWPRTGDKRRSEVLYRATDWASIGDGVAWKSSLFMPRWASRLTLEIVDERAEPLGKLTREEAWKEGMAQHCEGCALGQDHHECKGCFDAVGRYRELWQELNGKKYPWSSELWVWVLETRIVEDCTMRPHSRQRATEARA